MNGKYQLVRDDEALLRSDVFSMATVHNFSVLASHSVKQPVNPKTGLAFTTYERRSKTETINGSERNDEQRRADSSATVRGSGGCAKLFVYQIIRHSVGGIKPLFNK